MHFARTGQDWDKFEALRTNGSNLPIHNGRDDQWWRWYGTKLDYTPTQWLGRLEVPILAMWGGEDQLVPVTESTNVFGKGLAGNPRATLKIFSGADHGMSVQGEMVHLETMKNWLIRLTP